MSSGKKILSLKPGPFLALEPCPILVVKRRSISQDSNESPLVVIRQSVCILAREDLVLPPTSLHVQVFDAFWSNSKQLQEEDASLDDVTLPTASASSTTSIQLLSDTTKSTTRQVALPKQSTPFLSDSQSPQASSQVVCSIPSLLTHKANLVPEHALMILSVVPQFFHAPDDDKK